MINRMCHLKQVFFLGDHVKLAPETFFWKNIVTEIG